MMLNLEKKIGDPRYHGSLIIGAGRLKGEKREKFVSTIAAYNILLAVQCIVECEKDEVYEQTLLMRAKKAARNFSQPLDAERGILSLVKMQANQEIVKVFEEIKTPNRKHKKVIENLISNAESDQAIDFVLLLLDLPSKKNTIIGWSINIINVEELPSNYDGIRKLILKLADFPYSFQYGFLSELINKYNFNIHFIKIIIQKLIKIESYESLKFTAELIVKSNIDGRSLNEIMIRKLIENESFDSLKFATELIHNNNLYEKLPIELIINKYIERTKGSIRYAFLLSQANNVNYSEDKFMEVLAEKYTKKYLPIYKDWVKEIFMETIEADVLKNYRLLFFQTSDFLADTYINFPKRIVNDVTECVNKMENIHYLINEKHAHSIILFFRKHFYLGKKYAIIKVNASAGIATKQKLKKLFPHKDWWLNSLKKHGIIEIIDNRDCVILEYPNVHIFHELYR